MTNAGVRPVAFTVSYAFFQKGWESAIRRIRVLHKHWPRPGVGTARQRRRNTQRARKQQQQILAIDGRVVEQLVASLQQWDPYCPASTSANNLRQEEECLADSSVSIGTQGSKPSDS
ncbi:rev protein [Simian immunodeficiency virus]|uniref:Protein Rev n=1 Tax=Simian immunodeficiency virus TaxID=11723 RepID=Q99FH7_SIV|nr:rev protein [Simian immunodeficiency virus]